MPDPRTFGIKGTILKETEKGLLLSLPDGKEEWFPKSTIKSSYISNNSEAQDFLISKWILEEKGLIRKSKNVNVIGDSGSEAYLKDRLLRKGLDGFNSFKDIQNFKSNFSEILKSSTAEERKKLNSIIEGLKRDEHNLRKRLEEKKSFIIKDGCLGIYILLCNGQIKLLEGRYEKRPTKEQLSLWIHGLKIK